jgi:MHS family alpha-ketoglutarate permease-like MFS transporter
MSPISSQTAAAAAPHTPSRLPVRTMLAASIGNAVEWYDWTIYATFSIYFATAVFPSSDSTLALIGTFTTYAVAFFFRPLGGLLLGRLADLRGRRAAMVLSIVLMAGGSLVVGLLPTFAEAGWLAPALLVLARIGQALSVGGEASSAAVYLTEIAPPDRRGRYSSFFYASTGMALLLASLLGLLLSRSLTGQQLHEFGWRIPFLFGGLLSVTGVWLRRRLAETEQFTSNADTARRLRHPLLNTFRRQPKAVGQLVGFTALSTLTYYTVFTALTPFAVRERGADPGDVFLALSLATVLFVALQYPTGALADRYGRKPQLLVWTAATALLAVPASALVSPAFGGLLLVCCGWLAVYPLMTSITPAVMSELFPTELRSLGIGVWYNLTVAMFGGTAPLVVSSLAAAGADSVFFYYVAAVAVVAFLVTLTLPETKGTTLR